MFASKDTTKFCSLAVAILYLQWKVAYSSPNLVWFMADDLGWNDLGFKNPDIITPNIDDLATSGVIFNHSYAQPLCSPSRTAFMTGIYPFRLGLQHLVMLFSQPVCVPRNLTLFPQVLKQHGYKTHAIGKWHLGFCNWACTPTFRGFDSFYGFYNPFEDFYTKKVAGHYDFRINTTVHKRARNGYSTSQFTRRAEEIIRHHDPLSPLFLYMPFQTPHFPLQAPEKYLNKYAHIGDEKRRTYSAMVTSMDSAIGRVVRALKGKGIYNNTLIFFTSDNGGSSVYGASNFPLRGAKMSLFEGGTRVAAFLHGPLLKRPGTVYDGMIHAVDWFPTLANALGIQFHDSNQDGVNQWQAINTLSKSRRSEFVYNFDLSPVAVQGAAAIRVGKYKLIEGFPGLYQKHYQLGAPDQGYSGPYLPLQRIYDMVTKSPYNETMSSRLLFNLKDDPNEEHNLYDQLPQVARRLHKRLMTYKRGYTTPNFPEDSPLANPDNYGGFWSPGWC